MQKLPSACLAADSPGVRPRVPPKVRKEAVDKQTIRVGIIGAGFIASTRAQCYGRIFGHRVELAAVAASTSANAETYARRWSVTHAYDDYRRLLDLADLDLVDVCTPNHLHQEMVMAAVAAGKHVICTKPLTGYFGDPADPPLIGGVPKRTMFKRAAQDASAMVQQAFRRGVKLMYAENWVYAPAIQKAQRLVEVSQGVILEMRGGECHSGSHSAYSKTWRYSGGGALLRLASHPVGAALYLKRVEGQRRNGRPIAPVSVIADVGHLSEPRTMGQGRNGWLVGGWEDVEDWGTIVLTFEDGTKAVLSGSDVQLGGLNSALELSLSNARLTCRLSPTDLCQAYTPDGAVFGQEYLLEKLETSAGWSHAAPDEAWAHGHVQQIQDFVEAVAEDRLPLADGELGRNVVEVIYAAYVAAEEGRRIDLPALGAPASQTLTHE